MKKELSAYIGAKSKLLKLFDCESDFPIRILTDATWRVDHSEGVAFLRYRLTPEAEESVSVIINKDGEPWVTPRDEHSLVVAIDCVRFAFILSNKHRHDTPQEDNR